MIARIRSLVPFKSGSFSPRATRARLAFSACCIAMGIRALRDRDVDSEGKSRGRNRQHQG